MKLTRIVLNSGAPVTRECAIGVPDKGNQEPQQIRVAKLKAERNFCGYTLLIADSTVGFILSGTKNDFLLLHLHPRDPVVYSVRTEKPLAAAPGFCDYTPGNPFDAVIGGYKWRRIINSKYGQKCARAKLTLHLEVHQEGCVSPTVALQSN